MRNRILNSLCAFLICSSVAALASPTLAQERRGFGMQVQFGPDAQRLLRQAENHTNEFAAMLEQRNGYGLSERAHDLQSQLSMVSGDYDRSPAYYDRRAQIGTVLRVAGSISSALRYRRVDYEVQRRWAMVRSDLNRLARVYNLRQIA